MRLFLIGIGGFLGATSRYGLAGLVHRFAGDFFPAGTLVVNLSGCLMIGAAMCLVEERQFLAPETRLFFQVGFLGSFTTLSTVGYETFQYLRAADFAMAAVNIGANVLACVLGVALGWLAVKLLGI